MWGKIMISECIGYDYMACMDYVDSITHSLTTAVLH